VIMICYLVFLTYKSFPCSISANMGEMGLLTYTMPTSWLVASLRQHEESLLMGEVHFFLKFNASNKGILSYS
jgi:hypothetical protein